MINVGVIGCGHWGPNHVRIFSHLSETKVLMCADPDEQRLKAVKETFLNVGITRNYRQILKNKDIDAVCICSPTNTHFAFTREALKYGKHVLCEKPLALKPAECAQLKEMAQDRQKVLMVGHVFLFNEGISRLKKYIATGRLGQVHYAYSARTNLGPFRYDVNALWDLAPHDIAIFNYLFDAVPVDVSARGQKCLETELEDLSFATIKYPGDILVNVHVSWLDPKKVRQITIVGDQKMVVWDDLDDAGPIKLYDKHVEKTKVFYETFGEFRLLSKEGSITIPKISMVEPLKRQAQYFIDCIKNKKDPDLCDARKGEDVVKTLAAIQKSMNHDGRCVKV